jgi:hypothetical protein
VLASLARSRAAKKKRREIQCVSGVEPDTQHRKGPEEEAAERVLNTAAHLHQVTQDLPSAVFLNIWRIGYIRVSVADPGFLSRIPDPTFFYPGSRIRTVSIPDPGSSSKNLSILTLKKSKKMVF